MKKKTKTKKKTKIAITANSFCDWKFCLLPANFDFFQFNHEKFIKDQNSLAINSEELLWEEVKFWWILNIFKDAKYNNQNHSH